MAGVSEQYQLAVGRARASAMQSTDLAFRIRSMQEQDRERQNRDDLNGMEWLSDELGDLQWRKTATPDQVNSHLSQVNALRQRLGQRNNMDLGKLNEAPDVFTNSLNGFMAKAQQEAQRLSFLIPEQRQTWLRVKAAEARQLLGDQGYYAATHHAATSLSLQQYAAQAQTPPAQPGAQVPAQKQPGEPQKPEVDRMAVPAGASTAPKGLGELPIPVGDDFVMSAISPYLPQQVLPDALRGLYNDITNRVMEGKATPADLALYGDIVQEIQGGAKTPERAKGIVDTLLSSAAAYQGEKQGDEVGQLLTDADVAMSDPATAAKYKGMGRGTAWEQHLLALAKARGITLSYQQSQTIHQDAMALDTQERSEAAADFARQKYDNLLQEQALDRKVTAKRLEQVDRRLAQADERLAKTGGGRGMTADRADKLNKDIRDYYNLANGVKTVEVRRPEVIGKGMKTTKMITVQVPEWSIRDDRWRSSKMRLAQSRWDELNAAGKVPDDLPRPGSSASSASREGRKPKGKRKSLAELYEEAGNKP